MKAVLLFVAVAVVAGVFIVRGPAQGAVKEIKSHLGLGDRTAPMNVTSETQTASPTVSPFHAVTADGGMDIKIQQGSSTSVSFTASQDTLAKLKAEVIDGVLRIGTKDDRWGDDLGPVTATIETPNLDAVTLNGSGHIDLKSLDTAKLAISINGSASVVAVGTAKSVSFDIQGSGDIDSKQLVSDDVVTSISGSGSADVNASKTLGVSIAGSGNVRYSGHPDVHQSIAGSGSVSAASQ